MKSIITLCLVIVGAVGVLSAQVVTTGLDNGTPGTLRQQIALASAGSTITFAATVSTIIINDEIIIDKDLSINGTVGINTTIDAAGASRIFNITDGEVILNNLTLTNGVAADGGGIYTSAASLTLNACMVTDCVANGSPGSGGGIFINTGAVLNVNNSTLSGNIANRAGGAIEDNSGIGLGLSLNTVIMRNNNAGVAPATAAPGNGGAVHITGLGSSTVDNCTVTNNRSAAEGGGLWNGTGTMTITNTTISGNNNIGDGANQGGGGLFNAGGNMIVSNCTMIDNITSGPSTSGGAILNDMGTLSVLNTEINGNSSVRAGGGIEDNSVAGNTLNLSTVTLINNTTGGSPGNGGGLHITGPGNSTISDCVVTNNSAAAEGGGLWNGSGVMTVSGSMINNNTTVGDGANQGGAGIFNAGGTLVVNGGTINGNITSGASTSGGGILNDMGVLSVTNTEISSNASIRAGGGIEDNSAAGNTLNLTSVIMSNNTTAASPGNGGGLHITGPGNSMITDCTITSNSAAAEGGGLWNGSGIMTVSGSMINNNTTVGDGADQGGAGIFNAGGTLNVSGGEIKDNITSGTSTSGGGILNDMGVLTVTNTIISGNSSVRAGGGIEDNSAAGNTLTLTNVTMNDNSTESSPGNGGGLHITGPGDSVIESCVVNNNIASAEGGGLWNGTGTMMVSGTAITSNMVEGDGADQGGAGIFNAGGIVIVDDCSITNNTTTGTSTSGGGILNDLGTLTVTNSNISNNISVRAGGGIEDNAAAGSILTITNVTMMGNSTGATPGNGGGLHITGPGDSFISECSIIGNSASSEGGGLWNGSGSMTVMGCIINENTTMGADANQGGAGLFNAGGTMLVDSCSINMNTATGTAASGGGILNDMGTLTVVKSILTANTAVRAGGGIEDNSVAGNRLTLTEVSFVSNVAGASPGNGGGLHITGPGDSRITGCLVSTNSASAEGGGLWNGSGTMTINDCDITDNIALGNDADHGGAGVFNNGGTLNILADTRIRNNVSSGAAGSGGGLLSTDGIVTVVNSRFTNNSANRAGGAIELIDGNITFTNSVMIDNDVNGIAGTPAPGNGGGFHVTGNSGTASFTNSIFTGNAAGREGGALWNQSGTNMFIINCTIDDNTSFGAMATNGGAGVFNNSGSVAIRNSAIINNTDTGAAAAGGGIHNKADGIVSIMTSTISRNSSSTGGGVYTNGTALEIDASTIAFNSASIGGGGVQSMTGATFKNTIVSNNNAPTDTDIAGIGITSSGYNLIGSDDTGIFTAGTGDLIGVDPLLTVTLDAVVTDGTATHTLQPGSPAYNAGDPMDTFTDQNGQQVFNGRRDIGASEAQSILISVVNLSNAESNIDIFPNPTSSELNIEIPADFGEDVMISIHAAGTGELLNDIATLPGMVSIDLANYPSGIYVIKMRSEKFTNSQLVTKIK